MFWKVYAAVVTVWLAYTWTVGWVISGEVLKRLPEEDAI